MNKERIRRRLLLLRKNQPLSSKKSKDRKILLRIGHMNLFKRAKEIFSYINYTDEVETLLLLKKYFGKKKLIVPKVKGKRICLFELRNANDFIKGEFGILEPKLCLPYRELKKIDIAIVPGIAFDKTGHRIGFGGGYFDRFLSKVHCTTIGLAYEFQIIDKVPVCKYDVPVDYIVTEKRIIDCNM